jgi:hypothetical protein
MAMLNAFIRLGFNAAACNDILNQGFMTPDDIEQLSSEEVGGLCKSLRQPGGLIPNPIAVADAAGAMPAGAPLFIPNPGHTVDAMPEKSLKQMIYFIRHHICIGQPVNPANITLRNIRRLFQLKRDEDSYTEPTRPDKIVKYTPNNLREKMEDLDAYFVKYLGTTKIPLAYVTREEAEVPASAADPAGNYASVTYKMIRRAPHDGPVFATDNSSVWDVMHHIFHGTDAYPWIKSFSRAHNGRGAYVGCRAHYFG